MLKFIKKKHKKKHSHSYSSNGQAEDDGVGELSDASRALSCTSSVFSTENDESATPRALGGLASARSHDCPVVSTTPRSSTEQSYSAPQEGLDGDRAPEDARARMDHPEGPRSQIGDGVLRLDPALQKAEEPPSQESEDSRRSSSSSSSSSRRKTTPVPGGGAPFSPNAHSQASESDRSEKSRSATLQQSRKASGEEETREGAVTVATVPSENVDELPLTARSEAGTDHVKKKRKSYSLKLPKLIKNVTGSHHHHHHHHHDMHSSSVVDSDASATATPLEGESTTIPGRTASYERLVQKNEELATFLDARTFTVQQLEQAREDDALRFKEQLLAMEAEKVAAEEGRAEAQNSLMRFRDEMEIRLKAEAEELERAKEENTALRTKVVESLTLLAQKTEKETADGVSAATTEDNYNPLYQNLVDEIATKQEFIASLTAEKQKLQNDLKIQVERLREAEQKTCSQECKKRDVKLAEYEKELLKMRETIAEASQNLERERATRSSFMASKDENISQLKEEVEKLRKELADIEGGRKCAEDILRYREKENEEILSRMRAVEKDLAAERRKAAEKTIVTVNDMKADKNNARLTDAIQRLAKDKKRLEGALAAAESKVTKLEKAGSALRAGYSKLKEQLAQSEQQRGKLEVKVKESDNDNKHLEEKTKAMENKVKEAQGSLAAEEQKHQQFQKEMHQKLKAVTLQLEEAKRKIAVAESSNTQSRDDYEKRAKELEISAKTTQEKMKDIKVSMDSAKQEVSALKQQLETAQKNAAAHEAQVVFLQGKCTEAEKVAERKTQELYILTQKLEEAKSALEKTREAAKLAVGPMGVCNSAGVTGKTTARRIPASVKQKDTSQGIAQTSGGFPLSPEMQKQKSPENINNKETKGERTFNGELINGMLVSGQNLPKTVVLIKNEGTMLKRGAPASNPVRVSCVLESRLVELASILQTCVKMPPGSKAMDCLEHLWRFIQELRQALCETDPDIRQRLAGGQGPVSELGSWDLFLRVLKADMGGGDSCSFKCQRIIRDAQLSAQMEQEKSRTIIQNLRIRIARIEGDAGGGPTENHASYSQPVATTTSPGKDNNQQEGLARTTRYATVQRRVFPAVNAATDRLYGAPLQNNRVGTILPVVGASVAPHAQMSVWR